VLDSGGPASERGGVSGDRLDFRPTIESRGFHLVASRPKYAHSEAVQRDGVFPAYYFLFERS
jgi:hypothetical protein